MTPVNVPRLVSKLLSENMSVNGVAWLAVMCEKLIVAADAVLCHGQQYNRSQKSAILHVSLTFSVPENFHAP